MATSGVRLDNKTNGEVGGYWEPQMVALTILLSHSDPEIIFKQG